MARTPKLAWNATELSSAALRLDAFVWSVPRKDWVHVNLQLRLRRS